MKQTIAGTKPHISTALRLLSRGMLDTPAFSVFLGPCDWNIINKLSWDSNGVRLDLSIPKTAIPLSIIVEQDQITWLPGGAETPWFNIRTPIAIPDYIWTLIKLLLHKKPVAVQGYQLTVPDLCVPQITVGTAETVLTFAKPHPTIGQGVFWAYMRAIRIDKEKATLDLHREVPILGWDFVKDPVFYWGE